MQSAAANKFYFNILSSFDITLTWYVEFPVNGKWMSESASITPVKSYRSNVGAPLKQLAWGSED